MDFSLEFIFGFVDTFNKFFQVIIRILTTDFLTVRNAYINGLSYLITSIVPPYSSTIVSIPNIVCDVLSTFANGISVFSELVLPNDTLFLYHFIFGGGFLALLLGALRIAIGWLS